MIAKVYCERCGRYEEIEIDDDEIEESTSDTVPAPGKAGLKTYSIVHKDHILNVDIDKNGDVRSHKLIDRIGDNLEKLISSISVKLMNYINSKDTRLKTLVIVTRSRMIRNLMISIANQLMMNITQEEIAMLQVSRDNTILEFGNIQMYVGKWDTKILNLQSDQTLFAYHLTRDNAEHLMDKIKHGLEQDHSDYYAILFDTIFVKTATWKQVLTEIIQPNPHIIISDVGDPNKSIISISVLIDNLLDIR